MGNVSSKAWTLVQHFVRAVRPGSPVGSAQSERHLGSLYRLTAFMDSVGYNWHSFAPRSLVSEAEVWWYLLLSMTLKI